jgi:hypothetical protein
VRFAYAPLQDLWKHNALQCSRPVYLLLLLLLGDGFLQHWRQAMCPGGVQLHVDGPSLLPLQQLLQQCKL